MKKIFLILILLISLSACEAANEPVILEQLDTPQGLTIDTNSMTLHEVEHATSYVIDINGTLITVTDLTYVFESIGSYEIRYKAVGEGYRDSEFSMIYTVAIDATYVDATYTYSINSTFDLLLAEAQETMTNIEFLDEDDQVIDASYYEIIDQKIYLKSSYLSSLDVRDDKYNFTLSFGQYVYLINIEVTDVDAPYVYVNQSVVLTNQTSITFAFDTFGAELVDLYVNTTDGHEALVYTLSEDGILTIDTQVLFSVIGNEEDKEKYIMTYQFEDASNQNIYLGFLIIHVN